ECHGEQFRHSAASRLLRTDHPRSLRALARMFGLPVFWATSGALDHTVRSGQPAANTAYPGGFWSYLSDKPDARSIFNTAMEANARDHVAAVVAAYDFAGFRRIGDIGGGRGHLLRAVLAAAPSATGVLFDLPNVVAEAAGADTERLTVQGGSFLKDSL